MPDDCEAIDNDFALDELLVYRLRTDDVIPDEHGALAVIPGNLRMPDFSVNRTKFSDPDWVLYPHWPEMGYATFSVGDVLEAGAIAAEKLRAREPKAATHEFKPVHEPICEFNENWNFAHTSVVCFKAGKPKKSPARLARFEFRQLLASRMKIAKRPSR